MNEEDGPVTHKFYPNSFNFKYSINDLSVQLFQTTTAIYGYDKYDQSYGLLIDIKNINRTAYIFFDSFQDSAVRGNLRQFMFAILAKQISYFDSLKMKIVLEETSLFIREKKEWNIENLWTKVVDIIVSNN